MNRRIIGLKKPLFCIVSHRPMEWACALIMIGFAGILLMPGNTFAMPSYAGFVAEGISEMQVLILFGGIGFLRVVSLTMGGSPKSPRVRQMGAAIGGLVFSFNAITFAQPYIMGSGPLTGGVTTYAILALFEGFSIRIAGSDRHHVQ